MGRVPVKELNEASIKIKDVISPSSVGNGPVILFVNKDKDWSRVKWPNSVGRIPVNELDHVSILFKDVINPSSVGKDPVILLWATFKF